VKITISSNLINPVENGKIQSLQKVMKSNIPLTFQDFPKPLIIPCPNGGGDGDGET
jgi:hypothetical protein